MYRDTQWYHTMAIYNNIFSLFTEKLNTNNGNVGENRELASEKAANSLLSNSSSRSGEVECSSAYPSSTNTSKQVPFP